MEEKQSGRYAGWMKKGIIAECILVVLLSVLTWGKREEEAMERTVGDGILSIENDYIKWVDFTVSYEALCKAYEWDVETHDTEHAVSWVDLLAYTAAKTGGQFDKSALKTMEKAAAKLSEGECTMEELTEDLKYYPYYKEAYDAAIGGLVGEYWEANADYEGDSRGTGKDERGADRTNVTAAGPDTASGDRTLGPDTVQDSVQGQIENGAYVKKYGLKGYFPLARGFDYTHFDDFGVGRSYGYQRKHLGHDMMGLVGTPIMAIESGVVEALNRADAVAQIRQSCEVVLSLREVPKGAGRERMSHFHRIRAKSLALVCQQFAIILKAGLPLVQAVDLVAGQTEDKALGSLLRQVSEDVSNGWSLSYSLAQRGEGQLPITFRESVRAGEESGDLTASFRRMADYFQRMEKTRQSVMGALTYPAFVILVAVVVVSIIMGYAVPTFTRMFENMSVELPWITVVLIAVSHFFQKYVLVILGLLALGLLGLRMYALTEKGGTALSRLQLGLPVIGEIVRMSGASQFCHTMSTLLTAGMPILQSIEIAGRAISNQCISQEILDTLPGVEGGRSLGECMGYSQELPPMLVQMTAVGEATGSMEATLQVLAEYYDNEVDVRIKRALALLEPAIILVLAVFVVFILLAVYLPLFGMSAAI